MLNITFKLYATLMPYLPPEAEGHELPMQVDEGTSAYDLIDRFGIPRDSAHLVIVNGVYLPEEARSAPLNHNDTLAIWPPVAGG